jgi:hypothetical protein
MKFNELKQMQNAEVLKKRMELYPKIWSVLLIYGRNWMLEGKETDAAWAREFLKKLNACAAECGVIFSQPVYASFFKYREALMAIERKLAAGEVVTAAEFSALERIAAGQEGQPGLGTHLKADLGSYQDAIFRQEWSDPLTRVLTRLHSTARRTKIIAF